MIGLLTLSFALLLAVMAALEALEQEDVSEWARNDFTISRLRRMMPAMEIMDAGQIDGFLALTSSCHEGYTLTDEPFPSRPVASDAGIGLVIARKLALDPGRVQVGHVRLTRNDFSYRKCDDMTMELPIEGIVISLQLHSGKWLNAEVHPHEWHIRPDMIRWMTRSAGAFLFVGAIAVFFVRRLSRPLNELTDAARRFGKGLQVSEVREAGPPDLKRAILSFNAMQQRIAGEVRRRALTLAAISHDVRTPLTALRIKTELVDDEETRRDLIASVDAMEKITASALEFVRGESRSEQLRVVDLGALLESECSNFQDMDQNVTYTGERSLRYLCRPDALASALRNLIDNAIKYAGTAAVTLRAEPSDIVISVADLGPGIPDDRLARVLEPFERLSKARESGLSGFGLGLSIVKAIVEGHDGELLLEPNQPTGLLATIRLPRNPRTGQSTPDSIPM